MLNHHLCAWLILRDFLVLLINTMCFCNRIQFFCRLLRLCFCRRLLQSNTSKGDTQLSSPNKGKKENKDERQLKSCLIKNTPKKEIREEKPLLWDHYVKQKSYYNSVCLWSLTRAANLWFYHNSAKKRISQRSQIKDLCVGHSSNSHSPQIRRHPARLLASSFQNKGAHFCQFDPQLFFWLVRFITAKF